VIRLRRMKSNQIDCPSACSAVIALAMQMIMGTVARGGRRHCPEAPPLRLG
jgi:hypothetical protein